MNENKTEEKLEEKKKTEKSIWVNVPPLAVIFGILTLLLAYFVLKFTTTQLVILLAIISFVIYVMSIKASAKEEYLTEEEAKDLLKKKLENKKKTGEIPQNTQIDIHLISALPHIDGVQREYFMPFDLIDENNIPKSWLSRMDRKTGNTTYAFCPEGFLGTERPTIRHILPEDYNIMKRMGLEKSIWSKLIFGR